MISKEETTEILKNFGGSEKDSGSPAVQVAILTTRISNLKAHFTVNKHDYHSNRGLLKMIGRRRSLLKYLQRKDTTKYQETIKALGLRK